jgi:hypothetical protein
MYKVSTTTAVILYLILTPPSFLDFSQGYKKLIPQMNLHEGCAVYTTDCAY